mmetsp:Transcript_16143/g.14488  ORF Transcript_16143/g.14488 Transcript_16143/m.14488 type:complete len:410 (+) Transcript_16143:49-1278(+)
MAIECSGSKVQFAERPFIVLSTIIFVTMFFTWTIWATQFSIINQEHSIVTIPELPYCSNITESVYMLHMILYGMPHEFPQLLEENHQFDTLRDKSQNNTLILLNYNLTQKDGYIDYYNSNENIYYLYYPSNIADSYGEGHNYLLQKAFEFERNIKKCKHHYFSRMDPDIIFNISSISSMDENIHLHAIDMDFATKYNGDFKQMLAEYEPADVGVLMDGFFWPLHAKNCNSTYEICGVAHHDFCYMAWHRELAENPYSKLITKFDHLSWWSNAFFYWNINSWSFKNHVFAYFGFIAVNPAHNEYPRHGGYFALAVQYLEYHVLKNNSNISQCYPQEMIHELVHGKRINDTDINRYNYNDCGEYHKCISHHKQYSMFGYPKRKGNMDYSVSIDFQDVDQRYVDQLCPKKEY